MRAVEKHGLAFEPGTKDWDERLPWNKWVWVCCWKTEKSGWKKAKQLREELQVSCPLK